MSVGDVGRLPLTTLYQTGPITSSIRDKCALKFSKLAAHSELSGGDGVELARAISETPLPTIFVVGGILFWILAIAGSVAGKITIEPGMRLTAQLAGTAFIVLGLILFFVPGSTIQPAPEPTPKPTAPAVVSASTPPTAPSAPAATTAPPVPPPVTHARPSPGVNCTGTGTPDEVAICADARLIELDWQLYDRYHETLSALDKGQQTQLIHDESVWVTQRSACKGDANCLIEAYQLRIDQLKSAR